MVTPTNLSGTEQSGRSGGAQIIDDGHKTSKGPGPNVMDAATLNGDSVVNAAGEDVGKIEAIMLDVTSGQIGYAVLSFGGFLGMGKKLFALPWGALTLDAVEKRFVLDAGTRGRIRQGSLAVHGRSRVGYTATFILRRDTLLE